MNIIVSLGVGLLIFIVDKRQNHYLDEIIQTQHKLTKEIHNMITEEMRLINEMRREKQRLLIGKPQSELFFDIWQKQYIKTETEDNYC
ncbi:MAG: hypothetical protein WBZ36_25235 [Candidatus Nitrosopolaris sp.]